MNYPNQSPLPSEVSAAMSAYVRLVDDKLPGRIRGLYLAFMEYVISDALQ